MFPTGSCPVGRTKKVKRVTRNTTTDGRLTTSYTDVVSSRVRLLPVVTAFTNRKVPGGGTGRFRHAVSEGTRRIFGTLTMRVRRSPLDISETVVASRQTPSYQIVYAELRINEVILYNRRSIDNKIGTAPRLLTSLKSRWCKERGGDAVPRIDAAGTYSERDSLFVWVI